MHGATPKLPAQGVEDSLAPGVWIEFQGEPKLPTAQFQPHKPVSPKRLWQAGTGLGFETDGAVYLSSWGGIEDFNNRPDHPEIRFGDAKAVDIALEVDGDPGPDCELFAFAYDAAGRRTGKVGLPLRTGEKARLKAAGQGASGALAIRLSGSGTLEGLRVAIRPRLEKGARHPTSNAEEMYQRALVAFDKWRLKETLAFCDKALALDLDHRPSRKLSTRAASLLGKAGLKTGIARLEALWKARPEAATASALARMYEIAGDAEASRSVRTRQLAASPHDATSVFADAEAHLALREIEAAEQVLLRSGDLNALPARVGAQLLFNEIDKAEQSLAESAVELRYAVIHGEAIHLRALSRLIGLAGHLQRVLSNRGRDLSCIGELEEVVRLAAETIGRGPKPDKAERARRDHVAAALIGLSAVRFELGQNALAEQLLADFEGLLLGDRKYRAMTAAHLAAHHSPAQRTPLLELSEEAEIAPLRAGAGLKERASRIQTRIVRHDLAARFDFAEAALGEAAVLIAATPPSPETIDPLKSLAARVAALSPRHAAGAHDWLNRAFEGRPTDHALRLAVAGARRRDGDLAGATELYARAADLDPTAGLMRALADCLTSLGQREEARRTIELSVRLRRHEVCAAPWDAGAIQDLRNAESDLETHDFWAATSDLLVRRPQPEGAVKGVVFTSFYNCQASATLTALPLNELKASGVAAVHLRDAPLENLPTGDPRLDRLAGVLSGRESRLTLKAVHGREWIHDWSIDWENRRIEALGMNFWQPVYERLNRITRRFTFDVTLPSLTRLMNSLITLLDHALWVCEEVRTTVADRGTPVRFVSANWQYPPYAAYRIYCQHHDRPDLQFVAVGAGYENYYSNLGEKFSATAAAVNMTANPTTRAPFIALPEDFRAWMSRVEAEGLSFADEVERWIKADRSQVSRNHSQANAAIRERVMAHRAKGGQVIGAFGKIVYDLTVPYMGGPAHRDLEDFLNHTVESARGADTLILIKPHPHELRYEIAGRPNQFFLEMITGELPDNVILLDHRAFNIRDMVEMIDLGVMWNGTTGLELGASGVPVVMCDDWGPRDYPVGHFVPRDREHYAAIIRDPSRVAMPSDHASQCAALLKYMSTAEVMRPYNFARRSVTNVTVGPPVWRQTEVERYFAEGDPHVAALARRYAFEGLRLREPA